ncbi:hypothetical protein [Micromonospora cremea]|uniref:hypothetical protein n=1 Tax=Micromonospora cremea TaxID=709881 RepID=UPI001FCCA4F3|nr:hypothetical protein [Micromonospora cremea]
MVTPTAVTPIRRSIRLRESHRAAEHGAGGEVDQVGRHGPVHEIRRQRRFELVLDRDETPPLEHRPAQRDRAHQREDRHAEDHQRADGDHRGHPSHGDAGDPGEQDDQRPGGQLQWGRLPDRPGCDGEVGDGRADDEPAEQRQRQRREKLGEGAPPGRQREQVGDRGDAGPLRPGEGEVAADERPGGDQQQRHLGVPVLVLQDGVAVLKRPGAPLVGPQGEVEE